MTLQPAAKGLSALLDITAAAAAVAAIVFVICALFHSADQACIDRVFWSLCVGGSALIGAILVDRVRLSRG